MTQPWRSIVEDELTAVNDIMMKDVASAYPELTSMCQDIMVSKYSDVRSAACLLAYHACNGRDRMRGIRLAACLETLVQGVRVHQRIDDRGCPMGFEDVIDLDSASTTKVVVAGDFIYMRGFVQSYSRLNEVIPIIMDASTSINIANFFIADREFDPSITEEDCLYIMRMQAVSVYRALILSVIHYAQPPEELKDALLEYFDNVAMAAQISEDIADLISGESSKCDSIKCGRPTIPLFFAMRDAKVGQALKDAYSKRRFSKDDLSAIVGMIASTDAEAMSLGLRSEYAKKALDALESIPDSKYRQGLAGLAQQFI